MRQAKTADLPGTRRLGGDAVQLEGQVRRNGRLRGQTLKALEDENAKLKKLLAERCSMRRRCGSSCQKNGRARRQARSSRAPTGRDGPVGTAGLHFVDADRAMIRYRSRRPPDTELRSRCATSPTSAGASAIGGCSSCCGRRASRRGSIASRLYREEGLAVRKRRARRRAVGARVPILVEARPMRAGRPISFTTSSPMAGGSAS